MSLKTLEEVGNNVFDRGLMIISRVLDVSAASQVPYAGAQPPSIEVSYQSMIGWYRLTALLGSITLRYFLSIYMRNLTALKST